MTDQGICGDQFDLYMTKLEGGKATRITHDGLSGFPVWGDSGIAFSRFPASRDLSDCAAPGVSTDSGTEGAILDTTTRKLRRLGDFADLASSDGCFSVGSGGEQELILSVLRLSDGHRVLLRKNACCPSWNR